MRVRAPWLAVLGLVVSSAAAQDVSSPSAVEAGGSAREQNVEKLAADPNQKTEDLPLGENPYALKRKGRGPRANVHGTLVRAVSDKVEQCYMREQKAPISVEDRQRLRKFGAEVVHDLSPALLTTTSCKLEGPATPGCLKELAALDCRDLAEPIVDKGWDRNLTPEARARVAAYASALATREGTCAGYAAEEAAVVLEVRRDRLSVLIEAEIVIGKCEMLPEPVSVCDAKLASTSCDEMSALTEEGELTRLCDKLMRCKKRN